jgi:hypothetical protein
MKNQQATWNGITPADQTSTGLETAASGPDFGRGPGVSQGGSEKSADERSLHSVKDVSPEIQADIEQLRTLLHLK